MEIKLLVLLLNIFFLLFLFVLLVQNPASKSKGLNLFYLFVRLLVSGKLRADVVIYTFIHELFFNGFINVIFSFFIIYDVFRICQNVKNLCICRIIIR